MIKKDKVLLIFCGEKTKQKTLYPPMPILAISAPLIANGIKVDILDLRVSDYSNLSLKDYICGGISTVTGKSIKAGLQFAKFARRRNPELPLIWGGVHVSSLPEQTAQSKYVDIVVRGEGEKTFLDLVKAFSSSCQPDLHRIKGITFMEDGKCISTPDNDFLYPNEFLPVPYHLLDSKLYNFTHSFYYNTSRGCPHNCSFCYNVKFNKQKWRCLPPERVIEDLRYIVKRYNPMSVSFMEDNFFVSQERVEEICRLILREGFKFTWASTCRSEYFKNYDKGFIRLLEESGCRGLGFGGESGSQRILDRWCGGKNTESHILAVSKLKGTNIVPQFSFIVGFPDETIDDIRETFRLIDLVIRENQNTVIGGIITLFPFPGTEIFFEVQKFGFNPPSSLEEWSNIPLHNTSNLKWHSEEHLKFIDVLCKISQWQYIGKNLNFWNYNLLQKIKFNNFHFCYAELIARFSTWIRWRFKKFNFPYEINYLHRIRKEIYDLEVN